MYEYVTTHGTQQFIKVKVLRREDYLNYPGGSKAIIRIPTKPGENCQSQGRKYDNKAEVWMMGLLALKMEARPTSQGMWAALRH